MNGPDPTPVPFAGGPAWRRLLPFLVLLGVLAYSGRLAADHWSAIEQRVADLGAFGGVLYLFLWLTLAPCGLPASVLAFSAGVLFGPWLGMGLAAVGLAGAGLVMFAVGRGFLRRRLAGWIAASPRFSALERRGAANSLRLHLLAHLSPLNFTVICYTLAASGAELRTFVRGLPGALPVLVAYVWLGAMVGQVAHGFGGVGKSRLIILAVGVVGFLVLSFVAARRARRAWREAEADPPVRPDAP